MDYVDDSFVEKNIAGIEKADRIDSFLRKIGKPVLRLLTPFHRLMFDETLNPHHPNRTLDVESRVGGFVVASAAVLGAVAVNAYCGMKV